MSNKVFNFRFLAHITIEAKTPLAVGGGLRDILTDRLVLLDYNQLPYIPGTSLAGVLRHSLKLEDVKKDKLFGFQQGAEGEGSRLFITSAQLIGNEGNVIDGLQPRKLLVDEFFQKFSNLPIRQHVRITHKGAAADKGKFDEQVVFRGTRFCFEMEMLSDGSEEDKKLWTLVMAEFNNPAFRIGGGTRKGFGGIQLVSCKSEIIDLNNNLKRYLDKDACLSDGNGWWKEVEERKIPFADTQEWVNYELKLTPEDFFLFGSGLESDDADITYVTEDVLMWEGGKPSWVNKVFIPASSVKGTISHRTAFHFNKIMGITVEMLKEDGGLDFLLKNGYKVPENFNSVKLQDMLTLVAKGNPAVIELFGQADAEEDITRGNVIFSDFYFDEESLSNKLINHVSIDRFTGGAIEGALFSEEVVYGNGSEAVLEILVKKSVLDRHEIRQAFEKALLDICNGQLPLGGGTMRGHGCFTGKLLKNGKELCYE